MAAITDPRELRQLLLSIDTYLGTPAICTALKIVLYVFVRSRELRSAEWSEFDFSAKLWRIPAEKMKMKTAHLVPLATQVITALENVKTFTGNSRYCFPGARSNDRPISDNTLNSALRTLGWSNDKIVVHGFRSTASTLLNEQGWAPDLIEKQLAHQERNKVRAAYNRAEYLDQRRKMMQAWADYLDQLKNV